MITDLLFRAKYVSEDVKSERLAICHECPNRKKSRCGLCGCFLSLKTSLKTEECPAVPPKWKKSEN